MATAQANDSPTVRESQTLSKHDIQDIVAALYNFRTQNITLAASQRNDDAESEELAMLKVIALVQRLFLFAAGKCFFWR